MTKEEITLELMRYFDMKNIYFDDEPVFSTGWTSGYDSTSFSKYADEVVSQRADNVQHTFVLASNSLARALTSIATGHASIGLSSTGEGVAELICADGSVQYAVYLPNRGFKACVVPKEEKPIRYKLAPIRKAFQNENKDGECYSTVLILAILPYLMNDEEFKSKYDEIMLKLFQVFVCGKNSITLEEKEGVNSALKIISDNADLRIRYNVLKNSISFEPNKFMSDERELPLLRLVDVDTFGCYHPETQITGKFSTLV